MQIQMTIPAVQVQPGDTTVGLPTEKDYTIRAVGRVQPINCPSCIYDAGGWVCLEGDTEDGYYARYYEGEQQYYAGPDEMITILRTVA